MGLTSISSTSHHPSLDLYRHTCLACTVHYGVHPFDHGLLQLSLCDRRCSASHSTTTSSWQTRTGTTPGHSSLRSHSKASASFRPSAPVPWTGLFRRSVSLSMFLRHLPVSVRVFVSPRNQARRSHSCHLFSPG